MELSGKDYKRLISARTEEISGMAWGHNHNLPQPAGYGGQPAEEYQPDFTRMKRLTNEISELIDAFENSVGPG